MGLDTGGAGSRMVEHEAGSERVQYDEKTFLLHRIKHRARNFVG